MRLTGLVTLAATLAAWVQAADTNGFRELDEQRANFKNMYASSGGALGNLQHPPHFSSTTEPPVIEIPIGDKSGMEAIEALHRQLDDDANGNVDLSESDEFLREELKYEDGHERRQRAFHRNDDNHISVKELWEAWTRSEVHNWTTEQTTEWLVACVELPQYVELFTRNSIKGSDLPRLATNNQFIGTVLKIKDPIHIKKISLKAMDAVLFGPPKDGGHVKDIVLLTLLVGACGACWYAYRQKMLSQEDLQRMMKDMESLHMAEQMLIETQKELEQAKQQQESVVSEKENLERKLKEHKSAPATQVARGTEPELQIMRQEIEALRLELKRAEGELEDRCWSPPIGLQQWLQLTHEIENKAYTKKKSSAERQLQQAREACEKLKKKRSSLVGAFVSTHGKSIDDVDRSIVEASEEEGGSLSELKTSLNEVTQELQERVHRWKQIEMLCGFNIISNNGLSYLETVLYRPSNGRLTRGRMSSQDDLDDDSVSQASPGGFTDPWRDADSSGSERDLDPSTSPSMEMPVTFTLGGESSPGLDDNCDRPQLNPIVSMEKRASVMSRSVSQEVQQRFDLGEGLLPKSSMSEASLEARGNTRACGSLEEETYSTDSSASATATEEEMKRKRRKLHFPAFVRKSKSKPSSS
ncbi:stromal interaction molecule homolog isoform X2 [Neocloeon triangulifer]|uniref:stromal interaction molecule homolog isoform X2 n=1 Tax=Neocloeon triangulifer TaxID=2078957 RepID=UPI00286F343E|nr:stromal interaction molecule homolog isoform X2 [Neocloeon triangulifer]